jgi:hypothetical protein
MASTVDVLVPGLFVFVERLASRRSGEVPGHANVPQLSPSEGTKMTQPTTLLPGVSLTLLPSAGCAVGPNYKRPSVDVPGMCRGRTPKDVAQPAPESLGDLERWEVFHDKQLQDLIHTVSNRTTMFASRQREFSKPKRTSASPAPTSYRCVVLCLCRGFHPGQRADRSRAYDRSTRDLVPGGNAEALNDVGRKLRCALATALLHRRVARRIARPAKHSGH